VKTDDNLPEPRKIAQLASFDNARRMNSRFVRNLSNVFVTQDDSAIGITSI
jgi:hypothetical protein